jgi:hypothetical protein
MRRLGAILMLSSSQFQLHIFSGLDANLQLMTQEQKLWGRQELLSVHVAGKNQLENCEMCGLLSLSPFVCIQ